MRWMVALPISIAPGKSSAVVLRLSLAARRLLKLGEVLGLFWKAPEGENWPPEILALADRIVVFTARPGRIKAIVNVDLDRPRDTRSTGYHALHDQLVDLLADEVDRAFAEQERIRA